MPEFSYAGVNAAGHLEQGVLQADSAVMAESLLREKGILPVYVRSKAWWLQWRAPVTKKIGSQSLAVLCRQMAMVLRSGMGVSDGLELVSRQVSDRLLRREALRLYREVLSGRSLSEAMMAEDSLIPGLLARMVATGEASGNLEQILHNMSQYYQQRYETEKRVKGALIYPALLMVVGIGLLAYVFAFLIPQVESLLHSAGARLPLVTRIILGITHFLQNHFLALTVVLVAVLLAGTLYLATPQGKFLWDRTVAKLPLVGNVVRNVVTVRFASTAAMVFRSGIPVLPALELLRENAGNEVAARALDKAVEGVRRGDTIAYHLATTGYFDPLVVQMIRVGEETGSLDEIMQQMADFYEKEAQTGIAQLMSLLEPVMVLIMGLVVGTIVLSVMFPLFDLVSSFKR
ncbi:type II secretion system F family protein [Syntrophothermus lipocalidus]|uniref:Type II secretion system F domain protein n=1 Tax=Syntrophothermus lipocalidus (strain DSM 12680 / TGB-C1) TaxID=643648 RepID=D7CMM2_SYNLT|nr:type II secretion system F family protein [Syntrophothermus lipocalidus]ADI01957.1 Type II secretion system F domain protein [Syntrophothermus lipocalidus DSM 12680]